MGVVADLEENLPLAATILSVDGKILGSGSPFQVTLGLSRYWWILISLV